MRRKIISVVFLGLSGMLFSAGWLVGTESGNQRLLHWLLGEQLAYDSFTGTLLGDVEMSNVRYHDSQQTIRLEKLKLQWKPTALLNRLADIQRLELSGLQYELLQQGDTQSPPQRQLTLPLAVRIEQAEILRLAISTPEFSQQISRIAISARTEDDTIQFSNLQVSYQGFELKAEAQLSLSKGYPFAMQLAWQGELPELGPARGNGKLSGNLESVQLEHQLASPFLLSTEGQVTLSDNGPLLDLQGDWKKVGWPLQDARLESDSGTYQLTGPQNAIQLHSEAQLLFPGTGTPGFNAQLSSLISPTGLQALNLSLSEQASQPADAMTLSVQGEVMTAGAEPSLQLRGEWSALRWPMLTTAQLKSPQGQFQLNGPTSSMRLENRARLLFPNGESPNLNIRLQGVVNDSSLTSLKLETQLLGGEAHASGAIHWAPEIRAELDIRATTLDPSQHWPDWPGKLSFNAAMQGGLDGAEPWLLAELKSLTGTLHEQALSGAGVARYRAAEISLSDVQLRSGANHLSASGVLGETLDLNFSLDAPALASFWPDLKGQLAAQGRVSGTQTAPRLRASINAQALAYAEHRVQQLKGQLSWDEATSNGEFVASNLTSGQWHARELSIDMQGTPEQHQLGISVAADELALQASLVGGWRNSLWQGQLQKLEADNPYLGQWQIDSPALIVAALNKFSLQGFCFLQQQSRLCSDTEWSPENSRIEAQLTHLPLAKFLPWLPDEVEINGLVDGQVQLAGPLDRLKGELSLALQQSSLLLSLETEDPLRLDLNNGLLKLKLAPDASQASLTLMAGDAEISAHARIAEFSADKPVPLSGSVRARVADLKPLGLLVPGLSNIRGQLNADISLDGLLRQPRLQGQIDLENGAAHIPQLGLNIESFRLNARNEALDRLLLEGELQSGGGRLGITGNLLLDAEQGWPLQLALNGQALQIVQLPEAVVYASPRLDIVLQKDQLSIQGELDLPRAEIQVKELPATAVSLSDDEQIIGLEEEVKKAPPFKIDSRVRVTIGDAVHFSGFGLKTRLEGAIELRKRDENNLAQGELLLKDGNYKAYGQDLEIQQGRFIFNGPVQNPTLDVKVARLSTDQTVTAILNVNGSLRKPQASVSSSPALSEEEAMSYLLTGRGLSGSGPGKAAILRQVIAANGLEQGQAILNSIGDSVGLDEVQLQEGNSLEETSLLLGKYLSPDLYVSYAIGLFDNAGSLLTRYRLTEKLRLEVQSGIRQSMDVIYNVER